MMMMSDELCVRWGWLKFMYAYTLVGAGSFGLATLMSPQSVISMMKMPEQDVVMLDVYAALSVGFALLSILGLRAPLKFVPVLCLQLLYKVIWLLVVVLPALVVGELPQYVLVLTVIFVTYVIGDLIAIPFGYVFSKE